MEATILSEGKGKAFHNKSWRIREGMECWASMLTLTFGTTRTADLSALRVCRTFTPKEIPSYSFLLEAWWSPGLLNVNRMCALGALFHECVRSATDTSTV